MIVKILAGLVALVVLLLIVALFVKKDYKVERAITINQPREKVFAFVKYLKNQDHYNKWLMMDPNARKEHRGTDGTTGFVLTWDSENKNVGKGEQQITLIKEGEVIDTRIHFIRPFEGIGLTEIRTEEVSGQQTRVKWGMSGKSTYPFNLMNLFIDKLLGKDLEESLGNLKNVLEK